MTEPDKQTHSGDLGAMVVEDNEHMRTLLRALLRGLGIRHVYEYTEGAAALAQLAHVKPDFILTDLSMKPMDGLSFTRSLRHLPDDNQCVVPVIMVTGHTEKRRVEAARDAGVNELLAKPITPANLFDRVDSIVNRPRLFVKCDDYIGPCRRRKNRPDYAGPWRRTDDADRSRTFTID